VNLDDDAAKRWKLFRGKKKKEIGEKLRKNITAVVISCDLLQFFKSNFPVAKTAFILHFFRRFAAVTKQISHKSSVYTAFCHHFS
jgi:hypothetical protein